MSQRHICTNPQPTRKRRFGILRRMSFCHTVVRMYEIRSIDELVDFFGGDTELAELLGLSQSAVAYWKIRQQIGSGWHLRLFAEIRRRGATVDPAVFGLTEDEARGLFPAPRTAASKVRAAV